MTWTTEQKLEHLEALPWTIVAETTPEGDRLLRVSEIPSAVGHGATPEELEADLWASLRASLQAYLHFGDPIPLPNGVALPWASDVGGLLSPPIAVILRRRRQTWENPPATEIDSTAAAVQWKVPA